eukprot:768475-Hanusia_phi.AAC.6
MTNLKAKTVAAAIFPAASLPLSLHPTGRATGLVLFKASISAAPAPGPVPPYGLPDDDVSDEELRNLGFIQ